MKKVVFNLLAVAVLTTLTALTSCDDNPYGERELEGVGYFTMYADQTQYNMGVSSSVSFEWWVSIAEPENYPWIISVTPENGASTNECTYFINVEPNTSGIDRVAVILFKSRDRGRNEVLVSKRHILQKATTRDGQLYKVPESD